MAAERSDTKKAEQPDDESRAACTVCRGTGTVLSNLGGSLNPLSCPWCEGSGKFIPKHDAQAGRSGPDA